MKTMKQIMNDYINRLKELLLSDVDECDRDSLQEELNEINEAANEALRHCECGESWTSNELENKAREVLDLVQEVADSYGVETESVYLDDDEIQYYRDMMFPDRCDDDDETL